MYSLPSGAVSDRRFKSLRLIASIFTVVAWIVLVLGAIGVLVTAAAVTGGVAVAVLVAGSIGVALEALALFAVAAFIRLMMGIEENTRMTADTLLRHVGAAFR